MRAGIASLWPRRTSWGDMSHQRELALAALLAVAVTVAVLAGRGRSPSRESAFERRTSAFLAGPRGSKASYNVLARLGAPVERRRRPLFGLTREGARRPGLLVVLDPPLDLQAAEIAEVVRYVRGGGAVLAAGEGGGLAPRAGWVPARAGQGPRARRERVGRVSPALRARRLADGGDARVARGRAGRLGDAAARGGAARGPRRRRGAVRAGAPRDRRAPPLAARAPGGAGGRAGGSGRRRHGRGADGLRAAPAPEPHGPDPARRRAVLAAGAGAGTAHAAGPRGGAAHPAEPETTRRCRARARRRPSRGGRVGGAAPAHDASRILEAIRSVVLGQEAATREVVVCLLARGHVLLEGVPGTAKTLLVRALALALDVRFQRIQFTPDLMPADIPGVSPLTGTHEFTFRPGPIFADLVLADEINRAPAKTQAALLEAMQERTVTVDGVSHPLSATFTVFATQNPIEFEGTYPLPEAELDRFMVKVIVDYPSPADEQGILARYVAGFEADRPATYGVSPVTNAAGLERLRASVEAVRVEPQIMAYITAIVRATRDAASLTLGASPRAGVSLLKAARAAALLDGRDYVIPDDAKALAPAVLRHRVSVAPELELEGVTADAALKAILDKTDVPTT